jgi:ribosomal protein S18 acetylase RimI-like enzyme
VHIREATLDDVHGIARVHIDTWRTTYVDIVPTEYLTGLSYEQRESRWRENLSSQRDGSFTLVADADGSIVGFAGGGPEPDNIPGYDGELYGLYVLAAYQRRGIGRALMLTVARRLAANGFNSVVIWVLKDNVKARAFYETMGGMPVGEKTITIGGAELIEVAYGWPDIRSLNQGGERPM